MRARTCVRVARAACPNRVRVLTELARRSLSGSSADLRTAVQGGKGISSVLGASAFSPPFATSVSVRESRVCVTIRGLPRAGSSGQVSQRGPSIRRGWAHGKQSVVVGGDAVAVGNHPRTTLVGLRTQASHLWSSLCQVCVVVSAATGCQFSLRTRWSGALGVCVGGSITGPHATVQASSTRCC